MYIKSRKKLEREIKGALFFYIYNNHSGFSTEGEEEKMKFLFQCPCCSCFCFMKPKKGKPKETEVKGEKQSSTVITT